MKAGEAPVYSLDKLQKAAIKTGSEGVQVELDLNGGHSVYVGDCAFLQLRYRRVSTDGTKVCCLSATRMRALDS
jgi:hypothetical protein